MVKILDRRIASWLAHATIVSLGILTAVWSWEQFIAPTTPLVYTASVVYPKVVHAGEWIEVTREFVVKRPALITITRRLVQGDCTKTCVTYDMEPSTHKVTEGKYNRTRVHRVPASVKPGKYQLDYQVQWTNSLGKEFAETLPPLILEVVP